MIIWRNSNEVVKIKNENEIIKMAIHPNGHLGSDFLIQIDTNHIIRTYFGTRNEIAIPTIDENFFSSIRNEEERELTYEEIQTVLSLANELEETGVIDELGIADGTWEVVLIYNGVRYSMDYHIALSAATTGRTRHEGAYPINYYEIFLRLVDELVRLSPIEIEIY